jgi:hypothetical protein
MKHLEFEILNADEAEILFPAAVKRANQVFGLGAGRRSPHVVFGLDSSAVLWYLVGDVLDPSRDFIWAYCWKDPEWVYSAAASAGSV